MGSNQAKLLFDSKFSADRYILIKNSACNLNIFFIIIILIVSQKGEKKGYANANQIY
jgi:hypothetical protein